MKILLLLPPTDLDKSYGDLKSFSNPQPSIGVAYIAAVLRDNGFTVKVIDAYVESLNLDEIIENILQFAPDVVGMSVLTSSAEVVYKISEKIRQTAANIKILMGNLHASLFFEEILNKQYADFIIHREGEMATLELLNTIRDGGRFDAVQGISYKEGGRIISTPQRSHIQDLDQLPYPAWDLFPLDKYSVDPRTEITKNQVEMQILATRGCPNQCTFCSSRTEKSLGTRYRMRSGIKVVDEMSFMLEKYGSRVFSFMDLAFPLVRQHAVDLLNEIISRGLQREVKWVTECRVKPMDQELLNLMKEAGCVRINFGIESGNDETLRSLKKNFCTEDVIKAVAMAGKAGIEVDGMFMIGLPGETEGMIKQTVDFAVSLDLRYAIFNLFVPYPGCELYDTLRAQNKIHFDRWSEFTSYPTYSGGRPVYIPDGLTHEQMMKLQKNAMRKFYVRPKFIYQELKRIKISQIKTYAAGLRALFS